MIIKMKYEYSEFIYTSRVIKNTIQCDFMPLQRFNNKITSFNKQGYICICSFMPLWANLTVRHRYIYLKYPGQRELFVIFNISLCA